MNTHKLACQPSKSRNSVLVVDDTPSNLQLLFKYLDDKDYKVFISQNGKKALNIANSIEIDLILLDIMMPGIDGFETCRQLKNNPKTKDIPIIFMTAIAETKSKVKGFEMGAVDYVTKPIEQQELLARINTHIQLRNCEQRLNKKAQIRKILFDTSNYISNCIRKSLDRKTIFQTTAKDITKILNCDRLALGCLSDLDILIESQFVVNADIPRLPQIVDLDYCCADREDWKNYASGNVQSREKSLHPQTMQAQLFTPILLRENALGKSESALLWGWLIAEHSSPKNWSVEEIELCQNITAQFAIAINQKLLHDQISKSNQELKKTNDQLNQTNQKLQRLTLLDPLTKVFNRRYFDEQLNLEWRRLRRESLAHLSLIMCDVDCFKTYNDTYGHQQGDECLEQIVRVLKNVIKRPADVLARYGGEEFVVILPHTPQAGAIKLAESMRAAVQDLKIPHLNSTVDSVVTISLGVADAIPSTENEPELLIEAADQALYEAKSLGRNCFAVYQGNVSQSKKSRNTETQWVNRIRQAIAKDLFHLYAQPITSLESNNNHQQRFEILLRLADREDRVITPNAFLDIAARNSLMPEIDMWVIDSLLKELKKLNSQNLQNYHFSINLSGASLNSESFAKFLLQKLNDCHFPSEMLGFEITETEAIANLAKVSEFIDSLKTLGCSFALDDFGKGLSSLFYLKNLPVDYLKIDGSFITELNKDKASIVMVEAINHIAAGIGLKTVAEFVENQAILNTVRNLKVNYAQGYHLGYPEKLTHVLGLT